eukprot:Pgem_evm1s16701
MRTPLHQIHLLHQLIRKNLEKIKKNHLVGSTEMDTTLSYLDNLDLASRALLKLIDDSLDLGKLEAGGLCIDKNVVDLLPCVKETYLVFQETAKNKNINFKLLIDPSITSPTVLVMADLA